MDLESRTMRLPWVVVVLLLGLLGGGTGAAALHAEPDLPTRAEFDSLRATVGAHEVALGRLDERLQSIQRSLARIEASLDHASH